MTESGGDIIEDRSVDNPLLTDAEHLHQLRRVKSEALKVTVPVNLSTIMGGLAKFRKDATEAQQQAAIRFKAMYERAQLGGARAVDPSLEPVDGGWINPEAVFESGADARREWQRVRSLLGYHDFRLVEMVVIGEVGISKFTRSLFAGKTINGRMTRHAQSLVLRILDTLAVHWKLQSRP